MTPLAHHAGEQLVLAAAVGGLSGSLVLLRAAAAQFARRWRRHP